ncbi:TetR/AcrR family transcriptional regulator [Kineococcus gynurae]|uniref:TetR/AcrR family transcriptional regulator n=1 Tax=Kineococcus gynurae TaxID=452979 RepID=A0ABV5LP67_9ACTN
MGRSRSFEADEVVRRARDVFWRHGFEEASLPLLEAATGLRRSSLYHAFGSKRGLFDAAVGNYLDEVLRPRLRPLQTVPVAPQALADYLLGLRGALVAVAGADGTPPPGCLLLNTASGTLGADAGVREVLRRYRSELREAVAAGVAAASPGSGPEDRARVVTAVVALAVSALVLVRVDPDAATEALDAALALVGAEEPPG